MITLPDVPRFAASDGDCVVIFPGRMTKAAVTSSKACFSFLVLGGPGVVRAMLRMGFWHGYCLPCGELARPEALTPWVQLMDTAPLHGRDAHVLAQLEWFLDRVWHEAKQISGRAAFLEAMRTLHALSPANLTTAQAAHALGVSRAGLNNFFLKEVKCRPGAYLAQMKAEILRELLNDVRLTIKQIATHTGYSSASALACFCRRCLGAAPQKLREAHESEQ